MIPNTICCLNGKGGVLKTTTATSLAGFAAAAGWRTLLVDMDPQGNASRDLGYPSDGGEALAQSLLNGSSLQPVDDRRENLSYVAGGPALDAAIDQLRLQLSAGDISRFHAFESALAPAAAKFHLVVVDSPPREMFLRAALLAAVHYLVVPTTPDEGGIDGIADVLRSVQHARTTTNPDVEILGVALGPLPAQATRLRGEIAEQIGQLFGDPDIVFRTTVRMAPAIAVACRREGLLASEYELAASGATAYWDLPAEQRKNAPRYSSAASSLASDWQSLVDEILLRYRTLSSEAAA